VFIPFIPLYLLNVCYICCDCDVDDDVCGIETQDDWVVIEL
jgi:hypothetical protein